jgi:dTDP-4-dehydrorhamnose 3,5-epimerase
MAILANCASMPHDRNELIYIDPFKNDIPYDWSLKHG